MEATLSDKIRNAQSTQTYARVALYTLLGIVPHFTYQKTTSSLISVILISVLIVLALILMISSGKKAVKLQHNLNTQVETQLLTTYAS